MADNQKIYEKHKVLYHYTTKAGLKGILESQSLWATHYKYLNDTTEIEYMRQTLIELLTPVAKDIAVEISEFNSEIEMHMGKFGGVNAVAEHEAKAIVDSFYKTTFGSDAGDVAFAEPYITSFCSHGSDNPYIQKNGLLSQWRSYGGEVGFAIVFNTKKLTGLLKQDRKIYQYSSNFADIVYAGNDNDFREEFQEFVQVFKKVFTEMIRGKSLSLKDFLPSFVQNVSRYKHQGFEEEREVRIIIAPVTAELRSLLEKESAIDPNEKRKLKEIKYRKKGEIQIPYIELLDFPKKQSLPIERIIIGPHDDQPSLEEEVKGMTSGLGIAVHCCETPYIRR